jgi:hypothetical protein
MAAAFLSFFYVGGGQRQMYIFTVFPTKAKE